MTARDQWLWCVAVMLHGRAYAKTIAYHAFDSGTPGDLLRDFWRANLRQKLPLLTMFDDDAAT